MIDTSIARNRDTTPTLHDPLTGQALGVPGAPFIPGEYSVSGRLFVQSVPVDLLMNPHLTFAAMIAWAAAESCGWHRPGKARGSRPTLARIAERCGLGLSNARKALKLLEAQKAVRKQKGRFSDGRREPDLFIVLQPPLFWRPKKRGGAEVRAGEVYSFDALKAAGRPFAQVVPLGLLSESALTPAAKAVWMAKASFNPRQHQSKALLAERLGGTRRLGSVKSALRALEDLGLVKIVRRDNERAGAKHGLANEITLLCPRWSDLERRIADMAAARGRADESEGGAGGPGELKFHGSAGCTPGGSPVQGRGQPGAEQQVTPASNTSSKSLCASKVGAHSGESPPLSPGADQDLVTAVADPAEDPQPEPAPAVPEPAAKPGRQPSQPTATATTPPSSAAPPAPAARLEALRATAGKRRALRQLIEAAYWRSDYQEVARLTDEISALREQAWAAAKATTAHPEHATL